MFNKINSIRKIICVFFFTCSSYVLCAGELLNKPIAKRRNAPVLRTRFSVAPLMSIYTINKNHARNPRQKLSGIISLKEEIRLNKTHNLFFLIGAEYMVHGINFNSYYFTPESIQLYDGNMRFVYGLYIHEVDVPIQLKVSLHKENNKIFSSYFMIGYHLRTLLYGNLKVTQSGEELVSKKENITFKNPLITNKNNPFISITYGFQKNNPDNTRTALFVELSYRQGISPYLLKDTFTPSSLYMNGSHFSFGFGVKF